MPAVHSCLHCNGTTFCSASRDGNGKLKIRPSCICCIVKAGLDPQGIYDKVVCSVCGGAGIVVPRAESDQRRKLSGFWLALVTSLLAASLTFSAVTFLYFTNQQDKYEEMLDQQMDADSNTGQMTKTEVRASVPVGLKQEEVKNRLGEPYHIRNVDKDQETWTYRCRDGKMQITFMNGLVFGRQ
jgi:hypothetical protein